jgi:hypothetical protein
MVLPYPAAHLEPVDAGQHQIEDQQIGPGPLVGLQRGVAVSGERDLVSGALQIAPHDVAHGRVVVDHEHLRSHADETTS